MTANDVYEEKNRTFTGFTNASVNLDDPTKISFEAELRNFTLFTGMNGAGKTLIQKFIWLSTFVFNSIVALKQHNVNNDKTDKELLQFFLDNTFDDQRFNGRIEFVTREEILKFPIFRFSFSIINGNVQDDMVVDFLEGTEAGGMPTYLSGKARSFSEMEKYLKIKKMLNITSYEQYAELEKMCEFYKVYDVFAMETMMAKMVNSAPIFNVIRAVSSELFDELGIANLSFNPAEMELNFTDTKGTLKPLSSLSDGQQSMLFMLMSAAG